jgi:FixJ family two-component response regulator
MSPQKRAACRRKRIIFGFVRNDANCTILYNIAGSAAPPLAVLPMATSQRKPLVVVVEDEPLVRFEAEILFEEAGLAVASFQTADHALEHMEAHAPEIAVLFTDVHLPGKVNGLDLANLVANSWHWIEVLVTSGETVGNDARLPPKARFFPKPWNAGEIVTAVQTALANRSR